MLAVLNNAAFLKIDIEFSEMHKSVFSTFICCSSQDFLKFKLRLDVMCPLTSLIPFNII
jgi:hypothetical protein